MSYSNDYHGSLLKYFNYGRELISGYQVRWAGDKSISVDKVVNIRVGNVASYLNVARSCLSFRKYQIYLFEFEIKYIGLLVLPASSSG